MSTTYKKDTVAEEQAEALPAAFVSVLREWAGASDRRPLRADGARGWR
ncbi:hypothetical protein [Saccharothrix xinjiangensis]|uniref:Uncharacterized protein n=1 Tax=Saccharothrix xinjiangensis TaxID=204798 RepID=A0ABV9YAI1_9PSEU